jgi:hypothetical protein
MEELDRLFNSFSSVKHAPPGEKLHGPLSNDSPHIGHWAKAGMGQAAGCSSRMVNLGFKYLETQNLDQDPLGNTFGVIRFHRGSYNNPNV